MAYDPHTIRTINMALRDSTGILIIGATCKAIPAGTVLGGAPGDETTAVEVPAGSGKYLFTIDPRLLANNGRIARDYDIYQGINQILTHVSVEHWHWEVEVEMTTNPETFLFANLLDTYGDNLPTTIRDARLGGGPKIEIDRRGWTAFGQLTTTQIIINGSPAGPGALPWYVRFQIIGG